MKGLFKIEDVALNRCLDKNIEVAVIPQGVEKIGLCAFRNCKSLKEINIPEGVREIDKWAFDDCTSLTTAVVYKNTVIMKNAFPQETTVIRLSNVQEEKKMIKLIFGSGVQGCDYVLDEYTCKTIEEAKEKIIDIIQNTSLMVGDYIKIEKNDD